MKVLLVAEGTAGIQVLRALARSEHRIVAVMASPTPKLAIGATVWQVAQRMGYCTWPAQWVKQRAFADDIRAADVDILLNVHSLFVMDADVINAPRIGSFNVHPGPLPRYAGLNAVSWALYRGETEHGVTLHKMEPTIDTGPIVYQSRFAIAQTDTALSVFGKCITEGVALSLRLLEAASAGPAAIPLVPQDLTQREYFGAGIPHQGRLQWEWPARQVINFVRACDFYPLPSPWGYARCTMNGTEITIIKAQQTGQTCQERPGTVGRVFDSGIEVATLDEWVLVTKLMVAGRTANPALMFQSGDCFDDQSA